MNANNAFDPSNLDPTMDLQQPLPIADVPKAGTATITTNTTTSSSTTPPPGLPNKAKSLSCGTCRERKVRCDKNQPCSTCQRAKVPCIFPSAKRLPRKRQGERKKTNEKLLQRLNRLEALVDKAGLNETENAPSEKGKLKKRETLSDRGSPPPASPKKLNNGDDTQKKRGRSETSQNSGSHPVGKTAVEGEMSRYLGGNFWASLTNEVKSFAVEVRCIGSTSS